MKGKKPQLDNVVPMKGDMAAPVPDAPDFLTDDGRKVWGELAPILVAKDRLQPQYQYQFASYCEAVANFIAATGDLAVMGKYYTTKTRNGVQEKKRACWTMQQESMNQMRRDAALFGLTPVDENRLKGGGQGDLFDQLMQQLQGGGGAPA